MLQVRIFTLVSIGIFIAVMLFFIWEEYYYQKWWKKVKVQPVKPLSSAEKEHQRKMEIKRLLILLKDVELKLSNMGHTDYLNPLITESHPMRLKEKRTEYLTQLAVLHKKGDVE